MPLKFFIAAVSDPAAAEAEVNPFLGRYRVVVVDRRWIGQGGGSFRAICVDSFAPDAAAQPPLAAAGAFAWAVNWGGQFCSALLHSIALGDPSRSHRHNRAGNWNNTARNCLSANRTRNAASNRNNSLGFRLALNSALSERSRIPNATDRVPARQRCLPPRAAKSHPEPAQCQWTASPPSDCSGWFFVGPSDSQDGVDHKRIWRDGPGEGKTQRMQHA